MPGTDTFSFAEPDAGSLGTRLSLRATHYNAHKANAVAAGEPILDRQDQPIGPEVSAYDWCRGSMEGTLVVADANGATTVFNHGGQNSRVQVDCSAWYPNHPSLGKNRWKRSTSPMGEGVHNMILVPYRTIAVDGREPQIKYRSVVYVPEARGVRIRLHSGITVVHDGYFYAADTGEMKGTHVDVFVGDENVNPFPFIKGKNGAAFTCFLISDAQVYTALTQLHTP